jgi:hypothetical protein
MKRKQPKRNESNSSKTKATKLKRKQLEQNESNRSETKATESKRKQQWVLRKYKPVIHLDGIITVSKSECSLDVP